MKTILVVDGEPDIIELVQRRLEANNFKVISAVDGEEGIGMAQQQKPDLIIMDILMPNIPGDYAVRLLMNDVTTKHIPIIFLTGLTSNNPQGGEAKGVNIDGKYFTTIAKPFKPEKLLFEINRLLGNK